LLLLGQSALTIPQKVVFLDSDTLVRRNMDEIFDIPISPNQVAGTYVCACNATRIPHYPKDWHVVFAHALWWWCLTPGLFVRNRIPANCGYSQPDYNLPAKSNHTDNDEDDDDGAPVVTSKPRPHHFLNSGMFLCRPSRELMVRIRKMLDTSPLVPDWKFPDQDLISTFFGGGGEEPENWGDVAKEEIGDQWMRVPYYYNALRTLRWVFCCRSCFVCFFPDNRCDFVGRSTVRFGTTTIFGSFITC
jgi:hypothetical protein